MEDLGAVTNFLFEVGILAKTPRSGFHFLGSGDQSVAEHIHRVLYVGFALAQMEDAVDSEKVLKMCLFHDLAEARVSDLNYVHQKYTDKHEDKALQDLAATLPFGEKILGVMKEYEERKTKESLLAKDADQIEFILSLKEQLDIGNERARDWITIAIKRLKTDSGKRLAEKIFTTDSDTWWIGDKEDPWWVSRNKE